MRSLHTSVVLSIVVIILISVAVVRLFLWISRLCALNIIHIYSTFSHLHDLISDFPLPCRITWWHISEVLILLSRFFRVSGPLNVINLSVQESHFFFESGYLPRWSIFIESFFGDKLPSQILYLKSKCFLDGLVLFPHDVPPDHVELVQYVRDACFWELTFVSLLQLL